jgi:hypothetical protein
MLRAVLCVAALALATGCRPKPAPWSEAWLEAHATAYLEDPAARRQALVDSLQNSDNSYSRQRLSSYGLQTRGWDALPEWNPRARRLQAQDDGAVPLAPLWNGERPHTQAQWVALGREVFFAYPLRAEPLVEFAVQHEALAEDCGLERGEAGEWVGLVRFADVDGTPRTGITCALCHTAMREGKLVVGAARRRFDYGRLRLAYHSQTKTPVDPTFAARMASWGPGRADVTEDRDEDPVAIPDLFGLRVQSALTQAGTLKHHGPAALAIRQETQLLHSNHERVRPPRELAWALAMYVYSLTPPPNPTVASAESEKGALLFDGHCSRCHQNAAYGGPLVKADRVGTDPALADGAARGTGSYRTPPLVDVRHAAPYLHHGALRTLDDVLSPERLAAEFRGGVLGPGAVPGHRYGTELSAGERAALVAFLRTL